MASVVRTTARNLCKAFDRRTIMDVVRTVALYVPVGTSIQGKSLIHKTVLDICLFTVDVTVTSTRSYNSLENEIH